MCLYMFRALLCSSSGGPPYVQTDVSDFDVLLTVRLSIILEINQLNAQILVL